MIFIRADSNPTIAGGHIMRCLAIAKKLIEKGEQVCFLIADDNPEIVLNDSGVRYINLHSDWQNLMSDTEKVKMLLIENPNSVLLIDTYQITYKYVEELKPYASIAYLGSKKEFLGPLNLLINYSTDIDLDFYKKEYTQNTLLLLGPSYAPLRQEFQNITHEYKKHIERLLLTTGNTDKEGIIDDILQRLLHVLDEQHIVADVVIGRMFWNKDILHKKYDSCKNTFLHEDVKSMSSLMERCDLAISANGTTVYELSAMGIPIISFAMVEEQVRSAEALQKLGVIDYCGRSYIEKEAVIFYMVRRLKHYIENNDELINLAERAHDLIDGNGCQKIVEAIQKIKQ